MNPNDFAKKYVLTHREISGWSQSGGQCVDMVRRYMEEVQGIAPRTGQAIAFGNANQFFSNANPNVYEKIANGPHNFPSEGDVVVFNHGKYGHCAVAWRECSPTNLFTFDQNWSMPRRCSFETHSYSRDGVIGWLRKRR